MMKKQLFASVLVFSLAWSAAFSAGKKNRMEQLDNYSVGDDVMTLSQIDKLIKDTNYDKALEELNKYIDRYPENFDNAQTRVARIMNARNRYAHLAEELIQVIIDEPDDFEKIYKITYELEHLEKYPSDRQLAFIRETRIAAEFNYFRKEYQRIHSETEVLIKNGDYLAAANKSREGFTLYQERFYEEWENPDVVNPVNEALRQIDICLGSYSEIQRRLNDSVQEFVRAVGTEKNEDINRAFQTVSGELVALADIRNRIYLQGEEFKKTFEYMKVLSEEELTDASFLPFVSRFTLGQPDNLETGIAGAMNSQWDSCLSKMKNAIDGKIYNYVALFDSVLPESFVQSKKENMRGDVLPNIKQFSDLAVRVNDLNDRMNPVLHDEENLAYKNTSRFANTLPQKIYGLYNEQEDLLGRTGKATGLKRPENPSESELNSSDYTKNLLIAMNNISYENPENNGLALDNTGVSENELLDSMTLKYFSYTDELVAFAQSSIVSCNQTLCDYLMESDNGFVSQSENDYNNANSLYTGIQNIILERYPEKALSESTNLSSKIDRQISVIQKHINILPELSEREMAAQTLVVLNQDIEKLNDLKNSSRSLASLCRTQIQNSTKALNEAELRYNQAEIALRSENFDTARKRLADSREKYKQALEYSYSLQIQSDSDKKLQSLGERINQTENEIVVRDVRNLKTQAKNEYYAGNFEQAENLLTQASTRWALTNVEDDLEITSLRAMVNSALSMKTGRLILPSAPLYPEMSQLLSIAAQYYNEGSELIAKGKKDEGIEVLQGALQRLQELQLVYPLNQEASLLSLRIQKVLNPADYDSMFARKVEEARANYRNKAKAQESYADLQDLYEINPNYPGLKDLIYNVELEIGIRQKPVTNTASSRAVTLTREAQNIYNSANGNETKLKQALAKLDEAISLNPNNSSAIALKDKIQVNIGGKASAVLSFEDESRYQLAIQELQKNNIITANAIVEQLLQKQTNQNSTKIRELQKKIKALL